MRRFNIGRFCDQDRKEHNLLRGDGSKNADQVIAALAGRVEEEVQGVVVATSSGRIGVRLTEAPKGSVEAAAVSHETMRPELKEGIAELEGFRSMEHICLYINKA